MSEKTPSAARKALDAASRAATARRTVQAAASELRQALADQRSRIAELKAEIEEVERAPFDAAEAGRRVDEKVGVLATVAPDRLSLASLVSDGEAHLSYDAHMHDILALLAVVNPTGLAAGLRRLCAEHVQIHGPGLSPATKASRIQAAKTVLSQLELEEEALIREADAAGLQFARRPDANVAGILGLDRE